MPVKEQETNTLENFKGFNSESEIDFFGETPDDDTPLASIEKEIEEDDVITNDVPAEDDTKPLTTAEKEQKAAEASIEFFGTSDEETPASIEEEDDEVLPVTSNHITTLNYLKEKGLVDYKLEEGQELTDELAEQLVEDNFEESVEARVGELFNDVPQSVKNIVKYSMDGGDVNTLLQSMIKQNVSPIKEDMDLTVEDNQLKVVIAGKIAEGEDEDTASSYADFLKESGKLESVSTKMHTKVIASQKQARKVQLESAAEKKKQDKIKQRAFKTELVANVGAAENLKGLPITKIDKRDLPNYMADRNVKLEDGRQVTGMQRDLFLAMGDKDKSLILAKLLKNNFDFSSIAKSTKTKYTKEIKKNITRSEGINNTSVKKPAGKRDLASYF